MGTGKNGILRAEEAVAGYANVIEALREIIIYPIIYSEESRKLGLKVRILPPPQKKNPHKFLLTK